WRRTHRRTVRFAVRQDARQGTPLDTGDGPLQTDTATPAGARVFATDRSVTGHHLVAAGAEGPGDRQGKRKGRRRKRRGPVYAPGMRPGEPARPPDAPTPRAAHSESTPPNAAGPSDVTGAPRSRPANGAFYGAL